jgi:hypothetical protein
MAVIQGAFLRELANADPVSLYIITQPNEKEWLRPLVAKFGDGFYELGVFKFDLRASGRF